MRDAVAAVGTSPAVLVRDADHTQGPVGQVLPPLRAGAEGRERVDEHDLAAAGFERPELFIDLVERATVADERTAPRERRVSQPAVDQVEAAGRGRVPALLRAHPQDADPLEGQVHRCAGGEGGLPAPWRACHGRRAVQGLAQVGVAEGDQLRALLGPLVLLERDGRASAGSVGLRAPVSVGHAVPRHGHREERLEVAGPAGGLRGGPLGVAAGAAETAHGWPCVPVGSIDG